MQPFVRQRCYNAWKTTIRNTHTGQCITLGIFVIQAPYDETLVGSELIAGKTKWCNIGPTNLGGFKRLDGHRQHVPGLRASNMNGPGQRVSNANTFPWRRGWYEQCKRQGQAAHSPTKDVQFHHHPLDQEIASNRNMPACHFHLTQDRIVRQDKTGSTERPQFGVEAVIAMCNGSMSARH